MKKHLVSTFILIVYITILIKVMVFKDMPTIRIGSLMLNFSGTDGGHPANFVPFKTILPYLLGDKGLIIAGANLVGNIAPLVPIGFLVPFVYRNMTWKKSLALAAAAGLAIEGMQVVLSLGIFDIDDLILNALGVMIGSWTFAILAKWVRSKNYKNIILTAIIVIAAPAVFYGAVVYPMSHQTSSLGGGGDSTTPTAPPRQVGHDNTDAIGSRSLMARARRILPSPLVQCRDRFRRTTLQRTLR
jgi:glycopeptide antibiotics resistance protein